MTFSRNCSSSQREEGSSRHFTIHKSEAGDINENLKALDFQRDRKLRAPNRVVFIWNRFCCPTGPQLDSIGDITKCSYHGRRVLCHCCKARCRQICLRHYQVQRRATSMLHTLLQSQALILEASWYTLHVNSKFNGKSGCTQVTMPDNEFFGRYITASFIGQLPPTLWDLRWTETW